jgi:hypothetical protein
LNDEFPHVENECKKTVINTTIFKEIKGMVRQNTTVIFEGAFLSRLKTTCFGPFTGPSSGLKWSVRGVYTM